MTVFDEDVPMQFYATVQQTKDQVRTLLSHTDGLDMSDITEEDMDSILGFIITIDKTLADYPEAEDRCNRLRNLVIGFYALLLKGETING